MSTVDNAAWQNLLSSTGLKAPTATTPGAPKTKREAGINLLKALFAAGVMKAVTTIPAALVTAFALTLLLGVLHLNWSASIPALGYGNTLAVVALVMVVFRNRVFKFVRRSK